MKNWHLLTLIFHCKVAQLYTKNISHSVDTRIVIYGAWWIINYISKQFSLFIFNDLFIFLTRHDFCYSFHRSPFIGQACYCLRIVITNLSKKMLPFAISEKYKNA